MTTYCPGMGTIEPNLGGEKYVLLTGISLLYLIIASLLGRPTHLIFNKPAALLLSTDEQLLSGPLS